MKKIDIRPSGYGHFTITASIRGKEYKAITTNTMAIDRYNNTDVPDRAHADGGFTRNQAAETLYSEIKQANYL